MYLLCYGRSESAKQTGEKLIASLGGRWITSADFFASTIPYPESESAAAIVLIMPLEAACEILSGSLSQSLGKFPVICVSPDGMFAACLRYGEQDSVTVGSSITAIARLLGTSCFTAFGSNADIAEDLSGTIGAYSMRVSSDELAESINRHIHNGGKVSLYTDLPVSFGDPIIDSMIFETKRYSPDMHDDFIKAFIQHETRPTSQPAVFVTCRKLPTAENGGRVLVLTPRILCLGIELKSKLDPEYAADVVRTSLENHLIEPASVSTIAVSASVRDSDIVRKIADQLGASVTAYSGKQLADVRIPLKMTFAPERENDVATAAAYLASTEGKIVIRRSGGTSGVIFSAALRKGNIVITD